MAAAHRPPPPIFSPARRIAARRRADLRARRPGAARYILDDIADDMAERIAFLRAVPRRALLIGDRGGALAAHLGAMAAEITSVDPAGGWDEEQPYPLVGFDLVASLCTLDTVGDLVGALIHMRSALAPGGLMLASLPGAGCLPALRGALLAADGDRAAPRIHPAVDVRIAAQVLQRAGWHNPVVDNRTLTVRYRSLDRLVSDLRDQALGNVLAGPPPPLTLSQKRLAEQAFGAGTVETFELLTLTGWAPPR